MSFYKNAQQYAENIAFISESSDKYYYSDLLTFDEKISVHLDKRSLILHLTKNTYCSVAGYISFLNAESIPMLMDQNIDIDFLNSLLKNYKPKFVYLPKEKIDLFPIKNIIYENEEYFLLRTSYKEDYKISSNLALLLSTSGSTGTPKFVRLTYDNINSNALSISKYLNISQNDRAISTLPMSYTYMLSIINSHLLKGACTVLTEYTLFDKKFWELLKKEEITTLSGVPYSYEMLKKLRFHTMELPSLKYLTQAGGNLKKELIEYFIQCSKKSNKKFIVMYGQTEATSRMSYVPWEKAEAKIGSIGIAIPGGSFQLIDESNNIIKEDDIEGELVYKGPNVSLGYSLNCDDLNKNDDNKGVLKTGDLAKKDEEGFYYITGRLKRFLKLYGNRINLEEIERILLQNNYSCICAGEDDMLCIYSTEMYNEKELISYISTLIKLHKSSFRYYKINEIPRNEAGKILYHKLKSLEDKQSV